MILFTDPLVVLVIYVLAVFIILVALILIVKHHNRRNK